MIPDVRNLYSGVDEVTAEERFDDLLSTGSFRLERIVSHGQATPAGEWLDQPHDEWVMLVRGGAGLEFEGGPEEVNLHPGDCLLIPAHCRHRVNWTSTDQPTVWLALHYPPEESASDDGSQ